MLKNKFKKAHWDSLIKNHKVLKSGLMIAHLDAGGRSHIGASIRSLAAGDVGNAGQNEKQNFKTPPGQETTRGVETAHSVESSEKSGKSKANGEELTEEQERHVQELKQRDREVRTHEQAHATVGGSYASPPSYEYTVGPDGKRYATSGEVQIDASPVRDNPEATIRKMDIVIRAALAPAEPSSQDLQVAKQAQATRAKAQSELQQKRLEEQNGETENLTVQAATEAYETAAFAQEQISQALISLTV